VGAVEGPPLELLDAESSMAYERGGVRRLGVGRLLPGTELALVVEQEEAVVTAPTRAFLRRLGLVATLAVLIASAAAWWLGRRMTLPLRHLQGAAEGLGRGDYARRAVEAGHHEIAGVARTFNKMASETEAHVRALEESEQRFRSLVTATTQIVWWTDPEGNIAQPLPSWQSYTGSRSRRPAAAAGRWRCTTRTRRPPWRRGGKPSGAGASTRPSTASGGTTEHTGGSSCASFPFWSGTEAFGSGWAPAPT
jgi:PAS domain-containing protein